MSPASDLHSSCPLLAECHSTCPLPCLAASCAQSGHLPRSQLTSPSARPHQPPHPACTGTPRDTTDQETENKISLFLFLKKYLNRSLFLEGRGRRAGGWRGEGAGSAVLPVVFWSARHILLALPSPLSLTPSFSSLPSLLLLPPLLSSPLSSTVRLQTKSSKIFEELGSNF